MAKRFIDTGIFSDEWFSELSKDGKLFFLYCITNCDHAGVIKLNLKLCEFQTGIKSIETVIKELGKSLVTVSQELHIYFLPKFIKYQYPNFPRSNVKQQDGAISILKKYNLWDEKTNSYLTLTEDLVKSYGNGSGNGGGVGDEIPPPITPPKKIDVIKTHPLQKWIKDNLPNVVKMRDQITLVECETIIAKYPKKLIQEILESMNNYKPLLSKNYSVYSTCCNWSRREIERHPEKAVFPVAPVPVTERPDPVKIFNLPPPLPPSNKSGQ